MAFWNRFPYSNFHEINLDWLLREMKKISGSVSDFARQWEKALQTETGERQEADRQLQANIDAEQDRAEAAEEALGERIDQEIKDRQEADQAEQTAREEADRQLQANIDAEQNRAEAAEEALDQKIEAETSRAEAAEETLDQKIEAETSRAEEAEEALDQKIEAETDRATEKENDLQEQITAEVNRATAAEGTLDQKITTETERATAAEGALGDRIDGLEGKLEGVTGADSPFIRKDGTTATTGKIPLAKGGTSEVDPAAATDLVNLRSMQAADQALKSSMTEYVDNQLEAAIAEVHSIPAGGTAGQVLGKVDATDYNVQWVDQQGGGSGGDVPAGGTTGQVLAKSTDADYQTQWVNQPEGLPAGGTTGQFLIKNSDIDYDLRWENVPQGLPGGGKPGDILKKTSNYAEWTNPPTEPQGVPPGGYTNNMLVKNSDEDYDIKWAVPFYTFSSYGSTGNKFLYNFNSSSTIAMTRKNVVDVYANSTINILSDGVLDDTFNSLFYPTVDVSFVVPDIDSAPGDGFIRFTFHNDGTVSAQRSTTKTMRVSYGTFIGSWFMD